MSQTPPTSPLAQGAPMRCADVRPYLSAYVDGELAEPLRSQVARHVAGCAECAARAESYRATDALLARLPTTAPAPEVFHAVMAAAREQSAEPVERETMAARRLHIVHPEPRQTHVPAALAGRKSWVATAMPVVAALLLVTLAALAFRGLVTLPRDSGPASTPTVTGTIRERTQAQVAAVARTAKLPFTPVLPTYAPNGATGVDVSVGYASDKKTVISLDIVWTVTSSALLRSIRMSESINGYEYPGYIRDTSESPTGWQLLAGHAWQPLKNEHPDQLTAADIYATVAAGQHRDNALYIAVEAVGISPNTNRESLLATLRQVTLSMDVENKQIPLATLQPAGLVLHYKAQSYVTHGETPAWSVEVYVNPATDAQRVEASANGTLRYVDVSQGAQGYRWNVQTNAYTSGPRSKFSGNMNADTDGNKNALQIFRGPGALLQSGLLWYSGEPAKVAGVNAYDYLLVSAPNKTHVYIDQTTHQVVQVDVETKVSWSFPPSTDQVLGSDHCSYFTYIEYVQPEGVADKFSPIPPSGSHQGSVPSTLTCS